MKDKINLEITNTNNRILSNKTKLELSRMKLKKNQLIYFNKLKPFIGKNDKYATYHILVIFLNFFIFIRANIIPFSEKHKNPVVRRLTFL